MALYVLSSSNDQKRVALAGNWLAEKIVCPWCQDPQACCVSTRQEVFYCFACEVTGTCQPETDDVEAFFADVMAIVEDRHAPATSEAIDGWLDSLPEGEIPEAQIDAIVAKIRHAQEEDSR